MSARRANRSSASHGHDELIYSEGALAHVNAGTPACFLDPTTLTQQTKMSDTSPLSQYEQYRIQAPPPPARQRSVSKGPLPVPTPPLPASMPHLSTPQVGVKMTLDAASAKIGECPISFYFSDVEGDVEMMREVHKALVYVKNQVGKIAGAQITQNMEVVFGGDSGDVEVKSDTPLRDNAVSILSECAGGNVLSGFEHFNGIKLILGNRDLNKMRLLPNVDMRYPFQKINTLKDQELFFKACQEGFFTTFTSWPTPEDVEEYFYYLGQMCPTVPIVHTQPVRACILASLCRLQCIIRETMGATKNNQGALNCTACNGLLRYLINTTKQIPSNKRNDFEKHVDTLPMIKGCSTNAYKVDREIEGALLKLEEAKVVHADAVASLHVAEQQLSATEDEQKQFEAQQRKKEAEGKLSRSEEVVEKEKENLKAKEKMRESNEYETSASNVLLFAEQEALLKDAEFLEFAIFLLRRTHEWVTSGSMYKYLSHGKLAHVCKGTKTQIATVHASMLATPETNVFECKLPNRMKSLESLTVNNIWKTNGSKMSLNDWSNEQNKKVKTAIKHTTSQINGYEWVIALGGPDSMGPANAGLLRPRPFNVGDDSNSLQTVWQLGHVPNAIAMVGRKPTAGKKTYESVSANDFAVRVDSQYKRPSWCVAVTMPKEIAAHFHAEMERIQVEAVTQGYFTKASEYASEQWSKFWNKSEKSRVACRLQKVEQLDITGSVEFQDFKKWFTQENVSKKKTVTAWVGPLVYLPFADKTRQLTGVRPLQKNQQCDDELIPDVAKYRVVCAVVGYETKIVFVPENVIHDHAPQTDPATTDASTMLLGTLVVPHYTTPIAPTHVRSMPTNLNFDGTYMDVNQLLYGNFKYNMTQCNGKDMMVIPYFAFTHADHLYGRPVKLKNVGENSLAFETTDFE